MSVWRRWLYRCSFGTILTLVVFATPALQAGATSRARHPLVPHGTVTWALPPGIALNYIFPLVPGSLGTNNLVFSWDYLMYRPLYWFGKQGHMTLNEADSLALPPKFSNHDRVVTVTLKPWRWSDGQPITSRDVEFWMNELFAERANWWGYVPGFFPDDVASVTYPSSSVIRFTFKRSYSPYWILYNNLSQIVPLPQQAWDRKGLDSPTGNFDTTRAGAEAVYKFLNMQSSHLVTYATNPLWRVVDGPWRLVAFNATTTYSVLQPNAAYSGPYKPTIATLKEVPFTTDSAEFDSLRSGAITYGYLPPADASQVGYFKSHGYLVNQWLDWGVSYAPLNYRNPFTGPLVRQLYIRQAMQHLIDQPQYIRHIFHGYAYQNYGPIPPQPTSVFISRAQIANPYPFSVSAAARLLTTHGWSTRRGAAATCQRPGAGPHDCGAGIRRGTSLRFTLSYSTGVVALTEEVEAMKSAFSRAGIVLTLRAESIGTLIGQWISPCAKSSPGGCSWQMIAAGSSYAITYEPTFYPSGDIIFGSTGLFGGGFSNAQVDKLIRSSDGTGGVGALHQYGVLVGHQVAALWMPNGGNQISVISRKLHGALPQDPALNIYPEQWTLG